MFVLFILLVILLPLAFGIIIFSSGGKSFPPGVSLQLAFSLEIITLSALACIEVLLVQYHVANYRS